MKISGGEIIMNLRRNIGVSQEELAKKLFISQQKLSRIEAGDQELDIMEFVVAFGSFGFPIDDFWVMHLNYDEFQGYVQYRKIRRLLRYGKIDEIREIFPLISENPLMQRSFMSQFFSYIRVIVDEKATDANKTEMLFDVLKLTIADFDDGKIKEYRFSYSEILILNEIALQYAKAGENERAIYLLTEIVENWDNFRITMAEENILLSKLLTDLYNFLVAAEEYEKASVLCEQVLEQCRRTYNYHFVPHATYILGLCNHKMGKSSKEYMPLIRRAYHTARGIEQHTLANKIKEEYDVS